MLAARCRAASSHASVRCPTFQHYRRRPSPPPARRPGDLLALPHIANTLATGATPHSISAVAAARQSADERAVPRRMAAAVAAPERTALQQLATCTTFACLREVHSLPRPAGARFNYPHAM